MRKAICLLAAFVLLATSVAATSSQVTNINLSHQNGYTSARIDVDGTVRFSHQTEVAKDGKPFRVIVDILKATHHLGAKKFMALPKCGVQAIRTSQYAAKPEAVVRVVFDMAQEASYRVESNQHSVTVVFPDKGGPKFADWSTSAVVAAMTKSAPRTVVATKDAAVPTAKTSQPAAPGKKSPAEVNSAIDKDRLASLASKDQPQSAKAKPSKPNAENPAPPKVTKPDDGTPFPSSTYTPGTGQFTDQDKWADLYKKPATPIKKTKSADQPTKSVKPPVSKPKPATAKAPKAEAPTKTASTTPAATGDKKVASKPKAESKQQVTKKVTKPPVKAQTKTVAKVDRPRDKSEGNVKPAAKSENTMKAAGKSDSKTVAKADKSKKPSGKTNKKTVAKADQADSDKKSTSRFRRNPAVSKKIKGTMVAEFPKRLVVKYKTKHYRDPFETLINEAQVSSSPIEQRVPNVEGLRLVGILESEGGKNSALLEDANGYGYILRTGDRVKKGYVLRIESDRVYFQIFEYGWSRTLALHIEE